MKIVLLKLNLQGLMVRVLLSSFSFLFFQCSYSQQNGVLLSRTFDPATSGQTTSGLRSSLKNADFNKSIDGLGYIMVTNIVENRPGVIGYHGDIDIWVVRIDLNGDMVWQKTLGGISEDKFHKVLHNSDGSITIFGQTKSAGGDVTSNHGDQDIWIIRLSSTGDIVWQKTFGGSLYEEFKDIDVLLDGSYLVSGYTTSNNGDVTGNHGGSDFLVLKILTDGTLQWSKCYGGSLADVSNFIYCLPDGNIVVGGSSRSSNGDVTLNRGATDAWLIKLNSTGSVIWQRTYGGSADELFIKMVVSPGGLVAIIHTSSTNGDVTGSHGSSEAWVVNLDYDNGNIIWQRFIGGTNQDIPFELLKIPDGSFTIAVGTYSNDFDAATSHGLHDILIANLDGNGVTQWVKCFGGSSEEDIDFSTFGYETSDNSYYYGHVTRSIDGDVQNPYYMLRTDTLAVIDGWFFKLDITGNILWQRCLGGSADWDAVWNVKPLGNNKYAVIGITNSQDGDIQFYHGDGPDRYPYDTWVCVLGSVNRIKGIEFIDINNNGVKDINEPYVDWPVRSSKANYYREARPVNGKFSIDADSGVYNSEIIPQNPYYTITPAIHQSVFTGYNGLDSFSFALHPIPSQRDLTVNVMPVNVARPGFNLSYKILYRNVGTDTVSSGSIVFQKDPRVTFLSSIPVPSSVVGDTLKWDYANLKPFDTTSAIHLNFVVAAPPVVNINDTLSSVALILPVAGDLTPSDDSVVYNQRVIGSFDPNDKSENYGGTILKKDIDDGKFINYLIRFQNTGYDTAFLVNIYDTLDSKLEWNSFEIVATSHPYLLSIFGQNKIKIAFPNIDLVDSFTNEPGSHGFVFYRLKAKTTLITADTIKNSASIYFDYNLPIKTNTTKTIIVSNDSIICPGSSTMLFAQESGDSYQWQVDEGDGFIDVINSSIYSGSTNNTLILTSPPTSWYGHKYRCVVNNSGNTLYSSVYTLKFQVIWDGSSNSDWSAADNWSCGVLPDDYTDVVITSGVANQPEVNIDALCRSVLLQSGSTITIKPGFRLDIKGHN